MRFLLSILLCSSLAHASDFQKKMDALITKAQKGEKITEQELREISKLANQADTKTIERTMTGTFNQVWDSIDKTVRDLFKQADEASK